jgi:hypothetical protein
VPSSTLDKKHCENADPRVSGHLVGPSGKWICHDSTCSVSALITHLAGDGEERRSSNPHTLPVVFCFLVGFAFVSSLIAVPIFAGNQASRLSLWVLAHNSEAVRGADKLAHPNLHIQPADPCDETTKRRKQSVNSPTNSCQCFCVMDAPEIYQSPGLGVIRESFTAIQASNVCSSAVVRLASGVFGWD